MFASQFIFYEGLAVIAHELYINLLLTSLAVGVMALLILADVRTAVLVLLIIAMSVVAGCGGCCGRCSAQLCCALTLVGAVSAGSTSTSLVTCTTGTCG